MSDKATGGGGERATRAGDGGGAGRARTARFSTTDILQGAGAAAGTAAVVYVVGGMVMWLRFRKAGLPADQAVSLMERQQLLVIGLRLMVLPGVLTGVLAWLVMHHRGRRSAQLPDRARTVLNATLWILVVAFALVLPFSFASATWVLAALLVVGYLRYERRPASSPPPTGADPATRSQPGPGAGGEPPAHAAAVAGQGTPSVLVRAAREQLASAWTWLRARWEQARPYLPLRRREERQASPLIATMLVVAVAAVVSLGRQLDQPVQLLDSTVRLQEGGQMIQGIWISSDSDAFFVGVDDKIKAIPRRTVRDVTLGPPRERAPSPSILSRVLGGNRYAITPFDWWCNGERYAWSEIGDLCRTQIEVVKDGQEVQRRDLAGDAVPVTLRCPAVAKRPCRGFLRLASRNRYRLGPAALPKPVTFRSRVRPVGVPDTAEAGIAPGQAKVVCVPVDQGQRGLLRNTPPLEDPTPLGLGTSKRPLPFDLTISADAEGRNVVRSERYVVSVTRPDQPIEYWGDCSTLRIACRAAAGTKKAAAVTCTINGTRRFKGDIRVTITSRDVQYARAKATIDGTSLRVRPSVTRTLQRAERYQAIAVLGYGGSARKFWSYFQAR